MAERSGFFPYVEGDTSSEYDNTFLAKWVASFISNGVYKTDLAVTAGENMQVIIPAGQAWINGYYYRNDGPLTLVLANADGVLHRKDTVVLRWDINARSITVQVLQGTPASTPTAPAIVRTAEQYDLKLAEISVPAGTTAITQALITDTRLDAEVCGIVHAVVEHIDMTTFYQQIAADLAEFKSHNEADFAAWFQSIRNTLGEDAAGHLQNEIDAILAAKGQPNGFASLDEYGHIPKEQINMPEPTYSGKLVVSVTRYDGGEIGTTKVRVQNTALGMDLSYTPDALGKVTLHLVGNKTYSISLVNVPDPYYGEAATQYVGFDTENELNLQVKDQPDIIGFQVNLSTGAVDYTDGAADWTPMSMNGSTLEPGSFENSWLVKDIRPCLLKNGVVQYYLKKTGFMMFDYTLKENGDPSDITTGNDGDVMIEIPKVYMQATTETILNVDYLKIRFSKQSLSGYSAPTIFGSPARDSVYYAAYKPWMSTVSSSPLSISNVSPVKFHYDSSHNINTGINLIRTKTAGMDGLDIQDILFLYDLYIMLFKTFNLAAYGYSTVTSTGWHASGVSNNKPLCYIVPGAFKFLGIEEPFSQVAFLKSIGVVVCSGYAYQAAENNSTFFYAPIGPNYAVNSTWANHWQTSSTTKSYLSFSNGLVWCSIWQTNINSTNLFAYEICPCLLDTDASNSKQSAIYIADVHDSTYRLTFDGKSGLIKKQTYSDATHPGSEVTITNDFFLCFKFLEPIS